MFAMSDEISESFSFVDLPRANQVLRFSLLAGNEFLHVMRDMHTKCTSFASYLTDFAPRGRGDEHLSISFRFSVLEIADFGVVQRNEIGFRQSNKFLLTLITLIKIYYLATIL